MTNPQPPQRYWKTTVVIYSPYDPTTTELVDLARDATDGASFAPLDHPEEITAGDLPADAAVFFNIADEAESS